MNNQANPTFKDAYEILSESERVLEEAMDSAATADQQADISKLLHGVRDEKKEIVAQRLKNRNQEYRVLTQGMRQLKSELKTLKEEIKSIIKAAEVTAEVVGVLEKLVKIAAKVAP